MIAFTTSETRVDNESFFILLQSKDTYTVNHKYDFIDEDNSQFLSKRYLKEIIEFKTKDIPEYLCYLDKNVDKITWLSIKEYNYVLKPIDENMYFDQYPIKMLIFSTRPNENQIKTLAHDFHN
jgi:hypothetical protein